MISRAWRIGSAVFRGLYSIVLALVGVYLGVYLLVLAALNMPAVQRVLVPYVENFLGSALETRVELDHLRIQLFDVVELRGFTMYDQLGQPMITAEKLEVGTFNFSLLEWLGDPKAARNIGARRVSLEDAAVRLYQQRRDSVLNLAFLYTSDEPSDSGETPINFDFGRIELRNLAFSYRDSTLPDTALAPRKGKLNFGNVYVEALQLATAFQLSSEGLMLAEVEKFQFTERHSGLQLHELSFRGKAWLDNLAAQLVAPNDRDMALADLKLRLGTTDIAGTFRLQDRQFNRLENPVFVADLQPSVLDLATADFFVPNPLPLQGAFTVEGLLEGNLDHLHSDDFRIEYGTETRVQAKLDILNLTDPERLFLDLALAPSAAAVADARAMLPTLEMPEELDRVQRVELSGNFFGTLVEFQADGAFQTPIGNAQTELHLQYLDTLKDFAYDGNLEVEGLNLVVLSGDTTTAREINARLTVAGQGFAFSNMDNTATFQAYRCRVAGFGIDSAAGKLTVKNKDINGNFSIKDPEGRFNGSVELDFRDTSATKAKAFGDLQNLDLAHYGLSDAPYRLSTIMNVNVEDLEKESITGYVRFFRTHLAHQTDPNADYRLKNFKVVREWDADSSQTILLSSDPADLTLKGQFKFKDAIPMGEELLKELELFFQNDSAITAAYYAEKAAKPHQPIHLAYDLSLHEKLNTLLAFIGEPLYISAGSSIKGEFTAGEDEDFSLNCSIDSLVYDSILVKKLRGLYRLNKPGDKNLFTGNGFFRTALLDVSGLQLENTLLRPNIQNKTIDYSIQTRQVGFSNEITLKGNADLEEGFLIHRFDSTGSRIRLDNRTWQFSKNNLLYYDDEVIYITSFELSNENQRIAVEANVMPPERGISEGIRITIDHVGLDNLNGFFTPMVLGGDLYADVKIANPFTVPLVEITNGRVEKLTYNSRGFGDLSIASKWDERVQKLLLELNLIREEENLLSLVGGYDPYLDDLNFKLNSRKFPLELSEPFLEGLLSNLSGYIALQADVTGRLGAPQLAGDIVFRRVRLTADYIGQQFFINDTVQLNGETAIFNKFKIWDSPDSANGRMNRNARALAVTGAVSHGGFSRFSISLAIRDLKPQNNNGKPHFFTIDNRQAKDLDFYGRIEIEDLDANIEGNPDLFDVTIQNLDLADGTVVNVPLNKYQASERPDFVRFLQPDTRIVQLQQQEDGTPFQMFARLNLDSKNELNLIFDEKAGDIIKVAGKSLLLVEVEPDGDILMTGSYEIVKGDYLFTFQKIVNKQFEIRPGSTISWDGSPEDAVLDITASYERLVNLATLDTTLNTRARVRLNLTMKGTLDEPEFAFDIDLPNLSNDQAYRVLSLLQRIQNDKAEMDRQVFSLLILGQFAPMGEGLFSNFSGGGAATSSVTEFLSTQFTNLLGQSMRTDNFNIRLETEADVVNVALRLNLFNDRVTIERNGALASSNNEDLTIGNISIKIRLLPTKKSGDNAGQLSVEIFNRETQTTGDNVNTTRGLGIFYRRDFDRLIDFFKKRAQKERAQNFTALPDSLKAPNAQPSFAPTDSGQINRDTSEPDTVPPPPTDGPE